MNTCNTCMFWARSKNIVNNIADCELPDNNTQRGMYFNVEVTADDDQGLDFHVMTSGNFGCLLHIKK